MAVVKRYNPNRFFFSDRLMEKMMTIYEYNLTIVEAPTGFGKTTSVKYILNESEDPVIWLTIENDDKEKFFDEVCKCINNIDNSAGTKLSSLGYPEDMDGINKLIDIISEVELPERYIIVLDNFQYISNPIVSHIIVKLMESIGDNIRIVILTQFIKSSSFMDLILEKEINYISKNDLEFESDEIKMYFRECGVKLNDSEVEYLFKYTEGWISALYLQLLHYISSGEFESDAGIDELVCKAIWDKITMEEQDFLISISIYDSFSVKQALFIGNDELSSEKIKDLLNSNSFIRYDSKERKYYVHAILRCFLKSEFDKMDKFVKNQVYEKAALWYKQNENYYQSMLYYYKIKKYDDIYFLNITLDELLRYFTKENKKMFLDIISGASYEAKEQNIRKSIIFSFVLFLYNEKDFFKKEGEIIQEMISDSKYLRDREKEVLMGENEFFASFGEYNDLSAMYEKYVNAYEYMQSPSVLYSTDFSLIFNTPSVVGCFHRESGKADEELLLFEKTMIYFYKLTAGIGKGLEAVMKAELLFMRGEFKDAEVLCQKALYMAETRNQVNVYICTMFLMARMSCFHGDYENMKAIIKSIRKKIEMSGEKDKSLMADLCEGFICINLNKTKGIPAWLKDEKMIESRCSILALSFANVIYGKYLLNEENYSKFLGISGQMLGATKVYKNVLFEQYIYIYIAYANYMLGNKTKAVKFINEAIDISMADGFVMPFVENYVFVEQCFQPDSKFEDRIEFMNKAGSIYRRNEKKIKSVQNSYREDVDYGLTNRELQIAKLAAERLSNKEIADRLYIAVGTVKSNLKTIFNKLQIKSRAELKDFFD